MVNNIRPFQEKDTQQVIELWQVCNLIRPWNNPEQDIIRKQQVSDQLFLVLECNDRIIGTVMGGYDGHRGFMNYLAINPKFRGNGYGSMLVTTIEDKLKALGCPKIHLLIRSDNAQVSDFYTNLDYENQNDIIIFGKRLITDD